MWQRAAGGSITVDYVLVGVGAWLGVSLLVGAGWARFHADVRARETRARAIRGDGRWLAAAVNGDRAADDAPTRQIA